MRARRIVTLSLLLLAAVVLIAADQVQQRSVAVKETQVRDKPSYAGKILGKLPYTDVVQVVELPGGSSWAKVRSSAKKLEGWVSLSSLSKEGKLIIKEGDETVKTPPAGYQVSLAGKTFSEEAERETSKDKSYNYEAVDSMEEYSAGIPYAAVAAFFAQGGLTMEGGAR